MRSGIKELVRISAAKGSNSKRSNGSSRFNPNHRLILVLLNSLAETEETCFQRLGHEYWMWQTSVCSWFHELDSYLVDPASSHMLVSKIKPCMSKYKHVILWNCEWLIKSVIVYLMVSYYMDNCGNSRANTCWKAPTSGRGVFIR